MKNLASVFFIFVVAFGCDSGPKVLNWNKTASEQKFKVGDTIVVEGITSNIVNYNDTQGHGSGGLFVVVSAAKSLRIKWGVEISIPLFNPEQPDITENPNAPLGIVIGTIYNPSHNKDLQVLYEMYPEFLVQEKRLDAIGRFFSPNIFDKPEYVHPHILHRFRFIGTIHSIGRKTIGRVSLSSVDIEVSDITVISSEQLNKWESWRTDPSLKRHFVDVEQFTKEVGENIKRLDEERDRVGEEIEKLQKEMEQNPEVEQR